MGVDSAEGRRAQIFEGGHRIPLLMSWPKKIQAGRVNNETVTLNDLMATTADLVGYELKSDQGVDSTSILKLITGEADQLPDHPYVIGHDYGGGFCIRNKHWKLICPKMKSGAFVLYNLTDDIKETTNVAKKHPEIVKMMAESLKKYVENGRCTSGPVQKNYRSEKIWQGLPF